MRDHLVAAPLVFGRRNPAGPKFRELLIVRQCDFVVGAHLELAYRYILFVCSKVTGILDCHLKCQVHTIKHYILIRVMQIWLYPYSLFM